MKKAIAILGVLALGMFLIPTVSAVVPTYNTDFTCSQLVKLGIILEDNVSFGTLYLPDGFIQIDGCLFESSKKAETGTFYGEAYNLTRHETGLFVGGGY